MKEVERNQYYMSDAAIAPQDITLAKPSMYKVMLLNDEYTPVEFTSYVLQKIFHKPQIEASQICMQIHREGLAVCGFFTRDVAETKVGIVNDYARRSHHPLKCTFEEEV